MMLKGRMRAPAALCVTVIVAVAVFQALVGFCGPAMAADNPNKPAGPVKLVFVHHSSGQNWLNDLGTDDRCGGLGTALRDNNYFVSDTNYSWGPADADLGYETIGDHTNIGSWYNWFRGPSSGSYLSALYAESGQNCSYTRMGADPGGENTIVMFKSCFPNSNLGGSPSDPVPAITANPLRGSESNNSDAEFTVANAKGIYIDLLNYFRARQDKLFVVITAPPVTDGTYAANARAFNNWLVNNWLSGYSYSNVLVWDYYDVLTSKGPGANDVESEGGNHHRWWNGAVQYKVDGGGNTLVYPSSDGDHPNTYGNQKATAEFLPLLNVAYNRFKGGAPAPNPPTPPPSQWKSQFYFAEGYTGENFQEYACLENPNAAAAPTWVTCTYPDGTGKTQYYSLNPTSRLTIDINQLAGAGKEVSMRVVSTSASVVAERPMYFNYMDKWSGGHDVVGARAPASDWYFAEGTTLPGFDQYVTVLNPQAAAAHLTFRYMVEGAGETDKQETVNAGSRATFKAIDQVGPDKNVSLCVHSDTPIVAERPLYFTYSGLGDHGWTGGHDVVGANAPVSSASFAEGTTRGGFEEWLCIQNPNVASIKVNATYYMGPGQGSPVAKAYTVPAKERLTVPVNGEVGPDKDVSVKLTSTGTFVAERPMYFSYQGAWDGGHDVVGAGPSTTALFAEGYTGEGFAEWLCIQNSSAGAADVTVTYFPEGGSPIAKQHTVDANSRYTIDVNSDAGPGLSISAKVASDVPVMVERPMYFDFQGKWTGGHDVAGYTP